MSASTTWWAGKQTRQALAATPRYGSGRRRVRDRKGHAQQVAVSGASTDEEVEGAQLDDPFAVGVDDRAGGGRNGDLDVDRFVGLDGGPSESLSSSSAQVTPATMWLM